MTKMKNLITKSGIILVLLFLMSVPQADVIRDFKVLGRVDNQQVLQSATINEKNPAVFSFNDSGDPSFVLMLNGPRKIKNVKVYFTKGYEPGSVTLEIGDDLFTWKKASGPISIFFLTNDGAVYGADLSGAGLTGTFLRFVFEKGHSKQLRIAGIVLRPDDVVPLSTVRLEHVKVEDHSVTLKLIADMEAVASIRYGEDINSLLEGPLMINYSKEHIITIQGLLRGTEYYFLGIGQDSLGTIKYSVPFKVRTTGVPLPLFKRIQTSGLSHDRFNLDLTFNVPVKIEVQYGYNKDKLAKKSFSKLASTRQIQIKGLVPEKMVYYRINAIDKQGNHVSSGLLQTMTEPYNIISKAKVSGDFSYIGENLQPVHVKGEEKRLWDKQYSYINGSLMSGNIYSGKQELLVEFSEPVNINRIDLVWWGLIYSKETTVYSSLDGVKWDKVIANIAPDNEISFPFVGKVPYVVTRVSLNRKLTQLKCEFNKGEAYRRFAQYVNLRLLEVLVIPENKISSIISVFDIVKK